MAQYRQLGMERTGIRSHGDFQNANGNAASSIRIPHKIGKTRRSGRSEKSRNISSCACVVILSLILIVTFFSFNYLTRDKEHHRFNEHGDDAKDGTDAFSNGTRLKVSKVLKFGQGSVGIGRDSSYWDKDDRRRDGEDDEDAAELSNVDAEIGSSNKDRFLAYDWRANAQSAEDHMNSNQKQGDNNKGTALYNEAGRDELKHYEKEYEASLKNGENAVEIAGQRGEDSSHGGQSRRENDQKRVLADELDMGFHHEEVDSEDEYDDGIGIDWQDAHIEDLETRNDGLDSQDDDISGGIIHSDSVKGAENTIEEDSSLISQKFGNVKTQPARAIVLEGEFAKRSRSEKKSDLRRKGRRHKFVTRLSRKNVCFGMFVDENTLQMLSSEGQKADWMGHIGLWKIVVVKNLPYTDMRRVGKIPKFLTHRLFPSSSKLRLQSDPLLILEYFLRRRGYEYAISNHYDRHCVWEEVVQNKKLNKFNHTITDQQFAFCQVDGLKRFNALDPNKLLPSHVPEGSFIVRAHTPMSNLFLFLWFYEVDRFTPHDQLSFAYTYLKLRRMNPGKAFYLNMFKDCERRSMAELFHHRSEEKRSIPLQAKG